MATSEKRVIPPVPPMLTDGEWKDLGGGEHDDGLKAQNYELYKLLHHVATRLHQIETDAGEMMDPDKMMEMATRFLGGGML